VDSLSTKWSHVKHRLGAGQGKSASQCPNHWPMPTSINQSINHYFSCAQKLTKSVSHM